MFKLIAQVFSRSIGRVIEYFAAFFGLKMAASWAYAMALVAAFIALVLAFTLAINVLIHSIFVAMPSQFAFGQQFLPSNIALCISVYYTVQLSIWTLYIKITMLKFGRTPGI